MGVHHDFVLPDLAGVRNMSRRHCCSTALRVGSWMLFALSCVSWSCASGGSFAEHIRTANNAKVYDAMPIVDIVGHPWAKVAEWHSQVSPSWGFSAIMAAGPYVRMRVPPRSAIRWKSIVGECQTMPQNVVSYDESLGGNSRSGDLALALACPFAAEGALAGMTSDGRFLWYHPNCDTYEGGRLGWFNDTEIELSIFFFVNDHVAVGDNPDAFWSDNSGEMSFVIEILTL